MEISSTKQNSGVSVKLTGRLDVNAAPDLDRYCSRLVDEGERQIVFDLSGLEYLGSAGLRSFLALGRILKPLEGKVTLCGASGIVKNVLVMSGFSGMFEMLDSIDQAKG